MEKQISRFLEIISRVWEIISKVLEIIIRLLLTSAFFREGQMHWKDVEKLIEQNIMMRQYASNSGSSMQVG